jgi:hypothetical protein
MTIGRANSRIRAFLVALLSDYVYLVLSHKRSVSISGQKTRANSRIRAFLVALLSDYVYLVLSHKRSVSISGQKTRHDPVCHQLQTSPMPSGSTTGFH